MSRENGKRGVVSHIFWILVLLAFIGGCVFFAPYVMDVFGINQEDKEITFEISPQDDTNTISQNLRSEGIVLSARAYRTFLKRDSGELTYTPGIYKLNANMSYNMIISVLKAEPEVDRSVVKVVFPEGKTVAEMADILEENGICSADDFIKSQNEDDFDYDFVKEIENPEERGYRLEGYLFPATYEFQKNSNANDIVNQMLACFDGKITPDMSSRLAELEVSLDEIITLASVIQAEAFGEESNKNVSSVFWNRLNSTELPRLESNPTSDYAKKLVEDGVLTEDKAAEYDTYKKEGIPVGPQNNPGLDMIQAALYPAETDYLYFVTDSNGKFYYGTTWNEHVENCWTAGVSPY